MRYFIVLCVMFLFGCGSDANVVSSEPTASQGKVVATTEVDSGHTRGSETGDDGGGSVAVEEDANDGSGDSDAAGGTAENEGVSIYNDTPQ